MLRSIFASVQASAICGRRCEAQSNPVRATHCTKADPGRFPHFHCYPHAQELHELTRRREGRLGKMTACSATRGTRVKNSAF